ncbi:MAG: hypothetical protein M3151_08070 [Actinomycetota bacterium]|nr:hypothetical protein [Actinomycetota bacterium]
MVKIVSRDRSGEYVEVASNAAPAVAQVADHFHPLTNLRGLRHTGATVLLQAGEHPT